jgi:phenylacetate-CoA ligase
MSSNLKHKLFITRYSLYRPKAVRTSSLLMDLTSFSVDSLRSLHLARRSKLVLHAFDTSPLYQKKYSAAGFTRQDLEQPATFQHLPIITRAEIRANFEQIVSNEVDRKKLRLVSTGGSTGIPLTIGADPRLALEVISWRRLKLWGGSPGDNSGYIYRVIPRGFSKFVRDVAYYPTKRAYLSATEMSEAALQRFITKLRANQASYIVAYVGALKVLADFLNATNQTIPSLKFCWSTAAPLPDFLRLDLEKTFRVPVYSQYGSSEFYWIAAERTDRTGLDVDWDIRSVEVLDNRRKTVEPGTYGDLIVTDLINRAFPMIRYEIGDRGRFIVGDQTTESAFPILDFVRGRSSDTIRLTSGQNIPGEFFTTIFDDYATEILGFNIVQRRTFEIEVRYVPSAHWTEKHEDRLKSTLEKLCGDTPIILMKEGVDTYNRGKLKFVSSEIQ